MMDIKRLPLFAYKNPPEYEEKIITTRFRKYYIRVYENPDTHEIRIVVYRYSDRDRVETLFPPKPLADEWFEPGDWIAAIEDVLREIEEPLYHRLSFRGWNGFAETWPVQQAAPAQPIERPEPVFRPRVYDWMERLEQEKFTQHRRDDRDDEGDENE